MNIKRFLHRYLLSIIFYGTILISILTALGCIITPQNDWHDECTIIEYYVEQGDTLWGIAQQHKPSSMDIREWCYEVKQLNDIDLLQAGDIIEIYSTKGE